MHNIIIIKLRIAYGIEKLYQNVYIHLYINACNANVYIYLS